MLLKRKSGSLSTIFYKLFTDELLTTQVRKGEEVNTLRLVYLVYVRFYSTR